jgi:membrane protein implicated in regulation of membrane protease activity
MTDGYVVFALGAIVLTAVFLAGRRPFVLGVATAASAAVGFLVENALWVFAAAFLLAAAALAVISKRGDLRLANRNDRPSESPELDE